MHGSDYFQLAKAGAERFRDRALGFHASAVRVGLTVLGPDNVTRVPCGEACYPRCEADVFDDAGTLTITAQDDGCIMREYPAGQWTEATCFDASDHIRYHLTPNTQRIQDDEPRRKLSRHERLEGLADRGTDTHEEARSER